MSLTPKNWKEFQHYSDRKPAWIKLHKGLLDDFAFARLPLASRALAPLLWLLASEYQDGTITASNAEIAFRLHLTEREITDAIKPLIDAGFFIASEPLADCKQSACLEKEIQEEKQLEKDSRTVATATRPRRSIEFEEFWKAYPRRLGANPKAPASKLFDAAIKQGAEPSAIIEGARRCAIADRDKIGTPYIPQAVKWLRDRRWEDHQPPATAGPPQAPAGLPSDEELRKKYGQLGAVHTEAAPDKTSGTGADNPGELRREGIEIRPNLRSF